ncbi:MAG: alpha/beta hydrolase [Actinomycetota bacterium]|nr:alpha/beta hydrolase [Actinomycetota bacterium]
MIGRNYIAAASGGVVSAAAAGATVGLRRWRAASGRRLEAGSQLLELACGIVEVCDSGPLQTRVRAEETPVVLVVHGTPGGYDQARVMAAGLQLQAYRVVSVSRPGYLRTPLTSGPTPEAQADLYAQVLDAIGAAEAIIVAVSGGGPVGIQFALRHPARCARLVLLEALVATFTEREMYAALRPTERVGKWFGEKMSQHDGVIAAYLLVAPATDATRAVISSSARFDLRQAGYEVDMALFEDVPDYPFEQISAPTLVIHGTADTDVPFEQAQLVARRVPGARLVPVEGADHLTLWRHRVVGEEVRAFAAPADIFSD